jgi:hypothetical protein
MAHYINSPQTELGEMTRMDTTQAHLDFSEEEPSFRAPEGRDNLFKQMGGARQPRALSTPRAPLASLRNPNARNEFTPLMKSATTNRTRQVNGLLKGGPITPAALKQGFDFGGNTPLPEASTMDVMNSSTVSDSAVDGRTPLPDMDGSSDMSTPMALPTRGQESLEGNGNVLTLREQEAVSSPPNLRHCIMGLENTR